MGFRFLGLKAFRALGLGGLGLSPVCYSSAVSPSCRPPSREEREEIKPLDCGIGGSSSTKDIPKNWLHSWGVTMTGTHSQRANVRSLLLLPVSPLTSGGGAWNQNYKSRKRLEKTFKITTHALLTPLWCLLTRLWCLSW